MYYVARASHNICCTVKFSFCTRVNIEFLFPTLTDVLSTEAAIQLVHGISYDSSTSFIFPKMDAAVPTFTPITDRVTNLFN